jgi:hypothetical protein
MITVDDGFATAQAADANSNSPAGHATGSCQSRHLEPLQPEALAESTIQLNARHAFQATRRAQRAPAL